MSFKKKLASKVKMTFSEDIDGDYDSRLSINTINNVNGRFGISIWPDGWTSKVSKTSDDYGLSGNQNPLGSALGATIGSLEVFKWILLMKAKIVMNGKPIGRPLSKLCFIEKDLSFSLFDYSINIKDMPNPALPKNISLKNPWIIGVGAGGGCAAYALLGFSNIIGEITFLDPDEVTMNNLNRCLFSVPRDVKANIPKVKVLEQYFLKKRINVRVHHCPFQDISNKDRIKMDVVLSTVDSSETRRDIQWDLPRVILDAAVVDTKFYVNRIDFGRNACILCTHPQQEEEGIFYKDLSRILGIDEKELENLHQRNSMFTNNHRKIILKNCPDVTLPGKDQRFNDWIAENCSRLKWPLENSETIPVPFSTILAGIFLAGEIVKEYHYKDSVINSHFIYDTFAIPHENGLIKIEPIDHCPLCSNKAALDRFKKKNNLLS